MQTIAETSTTQYNAEDAAFIAKAASWRSVRIMRARLEWQRYSLPTEHRGKTTCVLAAPIVTDPTTGKPSQAFYGIDLTERTCTCDDWTGRLESFNELLAQLRAKYPDAPAEDFAPVVCKHPYIRLHILAAEKKAAKAIAADVAATIQRDFNDLLRNVGAGPEERFRPGTIAPLGEDEPTPAAPVPPYTTEAFDLPSRATLYRSFARLRLVSLCGMCANERCLIEYKGMPHLCCVKCRDAEEISQERAAAIRSAGYAEVYATT